MLQRQTKPANAAIILLNKEGRAVYLVCEKKLAGGNVVWGTPGGGVRDGEELMEAALREYEEECGKKLYGTFLRKFEREGTMLFVFVGEAQNTNVSTSETTEQKWFRLTKLPMMRNCAYRSLQYAISNGLLKV